MANKLLKLAKSSGLSASLLENTEVGLGISIDVEALSTMEIEDLKASITHIMGNRKHTVDVSAEAGDRVLELQVHFSKKENVEKSHDIKEYILLSKKDLKKIKKLAKTHFDEQNDLLNAEKYPSYTNRPKTHRKKFVDTYISTIKTFDWKMNRKDEYYLKEHVRPLFDAFQIGEVPLNYNDEADCYMDLSDYVFQTVEHYTGDSSFEKPPKKDRAVYIATIFNSDGGKTDVIVFTKKSKAFKFIEKELDLKLTEKQKEPLCNRIGNFKWSLRKAKLM